MKTQTTTYKVIPTILVAAGLLSASFAKAETPDQTESLIYNNRAFVHAIQDSPNPVADSTALNAKIVYVNKGYGQAIYSYPSNVAYQQTDFNVEYTDTAHGQAIHSYPNTNTRFKLQLVDNGDRKAVEAPPTESLTVSETIEGVQQTVR